MQKNTSHILIVATVIAMLPLQGFALNEQTVMTNTGRTEGSKDTNKSRFFTTNQERIDYIKNKLKEVQKKNLNDSVNEKDATLRAKKVRTLTEGFHNRKKNSKEVVITSTGTLDSLQSSLSSLDDSIAIKPIGNNMYSVTFQDGKNLDSAYFQDIDIGVVPEKLIDYPIIQPILIDINGAISPYLTGESVNNLWGMTKMETTNYQSGLSLQSNPVAIAIIDTGIDRNHKDLTKNTWVNTKEIAGNGIDDDANGYTDDVNGYDFANSDSDPTDDHGHGTHVSGTSAGVVNGGGVFGVNSSAKVVGLKVLSANGQGSSYAVYRAIYYAADNGIKVINMSLGGAGTPASDPICAAIDYAKTKGTITVVAAGNSNIDVNTQVPAGCANAITVGAVDSTLTKASFSNYGSKTDIAAPGVGIYSSTPGNTYSSWAGTSMATPHITGLVSAIKTYKPTLTVEDIKSILKNTSLTEPVTSSVNIGRFPNMAKIFTNLGIKSDSELSAIVPPTTGTGSSGTGSTTPPTSGSGSNGTGTTTPPKDTTPPVTSTLPTISLISQTGATLSVAINENGTGYYLVLPATTTTPTNTTVVSGNKSIALKANTASSIKIDGLNANTAYKVWFIAKDLAGNIQTSVSSVTFTTSAVVTVPKDTTPPITTSTPTISLTTQTGTTLSVTINENGTGYYLVLPSTNTAPTNTTVVSGNKSFALKANTKASIFIGGLNANTAYKVWFVAKDLAGNIQTSVSSVAFTTSAVIVPPKTNIPPTVTLTAKLVRKNTYTLEAIGKDTDGTIKKYEMYVNGYVFTNLSKVTVGISGGNITVIAKVYDNLGASATSPGVVLQYVK